MSLQAMIDQYGPRRTVLAYDTACLAIEAWTLSVRGNAPELCDALETICTDLSAAANYAHEIALAGSGGQDCQDAGTSVPPGTGSPLTTPSSKDQAGPVEPAKS